MKIKKIWFLIFLILLTGCALQKTTTFNYPKKELSVVASTSTATTTMEVTKAEVKSQIKILAVGDIMTSRVVEQKMKAKGFAYPFAKLNDSLSAADVTFANLETSITPGAKVNTGEMMFRADPQTAVQLKDAGIDIVSLANNHTPNYGQKGLLDTFKYLDEQGIKYIGAGKNISEARQLKITETNGIKIGWLAYNADDVVPASYQASSKLAGTVFMDVDKMRTDVASAKKQVDLVFVSMHAGTEYTEVPNSMQVDFAHAAIDAGADLIIGHHPHVVQHLEKYKDKFIIYSLGNFIFDQMWSEPTRHGLMVEVMASKSQVNELKFTPIVIDDYSQPRLATEKESVPILKSLDYELDEGNVAR